MARTDSLSEPAIFANLAALSAASAWVASPETLISMNLMRSSLLHESSLVRQTTVIEVEIIRWVLGLSAVLFVMLAIFWDQIASNDRYIRFINADSVIPSAVRAKRRKLFSIPIAALLTLAAGSAVFSLFGDSFLEERAIRSMAREDGVFETATAVVLLIAAAIAAIGAYLVGVRNRRFPMLAFLTLLFFLMSGEEISWGQRFLNVATPEQWASVNVQGETNFHNLYGYFFDHLFIFFFFVWLVVFPYLDRNTRFFHQVFSRIGMPIASVGLSLSVLALYILFFGLIGKVLPEVEGVRAAEIREFLSSIVFLILMIETVSEIRGFPSMAAKLAP